MLGQHCLCDIITLDDNNDDLYTDPWRGARQSMTQEGQDDSSKHRSAGAGASSFQAVAGSGLRRGGWGGARQVLRTDDVSSPQLWGEAKRRCFSWGISD